MALRTPWCPGFQESPNQYFNNLCISWRGLRLSLLCGLDPQADSCHSEDGHQKTQAYK